MGVGTLNVISALVVVGDGHGHVGFGVGKAREVPSGVGAFQGLGAALMMSLSMALVADGWHMASHASALGITAFAYAMARKHKDNRKFTFGTGKIGDLLGKPKEEKTK